MTFIGGIDYHTLYSLHNFILAFEIIKYPCGSSTHGKSNIKVIIFKYIMY